MSWPGAFPERFVSRPTRGFWVGIALLGVVAVMALVVPAEPLGVDQRWSEAMLDIRTSFFTDLALVFNWLGRGLGCALSLAAVGIVLIARHRWLALLAFGVTEAVTALSSTLLKILVGRARPPDGLVHPVGSSFPSGHAAYAGATCFALVLLFTAPEPHRKLGLGARGAGSARDGLEPYISPSPLALGRRRRIVARRRLRAHLLRWRPTDGGRAAHTRRARISRVSIGAQCDAGDRPKASGRDEPREGLEEYVSTRNRIVPWGEVRSPANQRTPGAGNCAGASASADVTGGFPECPSLAKVAASPGWVEEDPAVDVIHSQARGQFRHRAIREPRS